MKLLSMAFMAAALVNGSTLYTVTDMGTSGENGPEMNFKTGSFRVLPHGSWSAEYGVNAWGEVVGYGDTGNGAFRAFTWTESSGMTMLGTLGGWDSWGLAINDNGEVVGHSTTASGYIHAFATWGGKLNDLGTLGGFSSYAYGVNNAGSIVGYSTMSDGGMDAFVHEGDAMEDLNMLISPGSGWHLSAAYSIDNGGKILGEGVYEGARHEFCLDPAAVPEPSTLPLLGAGLALIGGFRLKRRC
jgi:probable HAF family extracellular repeat protein